MIASFIQISFPSSLFLRHSVLQVSRTKSTFRFLVLCQGDKARKNHPSLNTNKCWRYDWWSSYSFLIIFCAIRSATNTASDYSIPNFFKRSISNNFSFITITTIQWCSICYRFPIPILPQQRLVKCTIPPSKDRTTQMDEISYLCFMNNTPTLCIKNGEYIRHDMIVRLFEP